MAIRYDLLHVLSPCLSNITAYSVKGISDFVAGRTSILPSDWRRDTPKVAYSVFTITPHLLQNHSGLFSSLFVHRNCLLHKVIDSEYNHSNTRRRFSPYGRLRFNLYPRPCQHIPPSQCAKCASASLCCHSVLINLGAGPPHRAKRCDREAVEGMPSDSDAQRALNQTSCPVSLITLHHNGIVLLQSDINSIPQNP